MRKIINVLLFLKWSALVGSANIQREVTQCTVCLETVSDLTLAPCNKHTFHKSCLAEWLKNRDDCPNCRHKPSTPDDGVQRLLKKLAYVVRPQTRSKRMRRRVFTILNTGNRALSLTITKLRSRGIPLGPIVDCFVLGGRSYEISVSRRTESVHLTAAGSMSPEALTPANIQIRYPFPNLVIASLISRGQMAPREIKLAALIEQELTAPSQ